MLKMSKYKKLDDFVLFHYTYYSGYKGIMKTMELRSSYYMTDGGEESISGVGNPKKIYTMLYKKDKLKDLFKYFIGSAFFIFDPRMLLDYRDKVNFPFEEGFGGDSHPYKRFPKKPIKGFEGLWPENDDEELALNLHHFYNMSMEHYNRPRDNEITDKGPLTNELVIETDFIPIEKYLLEVHPPAKYKLKPIYFNVKK